MAFNIVKLSQQQNQQQLQLQKPTQNHIEYLTCCVCFQDSEIVQQLLLTFDFSKEQLDRIVDTFPNLFTLQDHSHVSIKIIKMFIYRSVSRIYVCPRLRNLDWKIIQQCQIYKVQIWIVHDIIEQTQEFLNMCLKFGMSVNIGMNFFFKSSFDYTRRFGTFRYWARKYLYNILKNSDINNNSNNANTRLVVDRIMMYIPF